MTEITLQPTSMVVEKKQFNDLEPKDKMAVAGQISTILCDVIERQKLYTNIQGRKYVNVEGWTTLGSLIKVLPKEREVIRHENGTYEAYVDLISPNGDVVGSGSAICGVGESSWMQRPEFARRSMAITRATGKAYRLGYSWMMSMAGYEPTPREEMDHVEPVAYEEIDKSPYKGDDYQKRKLMDICEKEHSITDPKILGEISKAMDGIAMSALENMIGNYVAERTL